MARGKKWFKNSEITHKNMEYSIIIWNALFINSYVIYQYNIKLCRLYFMYWHLLNNYIVFKKTKKYKDGFNCCIKLHTSPNICFTALMICVLRNVALKSALLASANTLKKNIYYTLIKNKLIFF